MAEQDDVPGSGGRPGRARLCWGRAADRVSGAQTMVRVCRSSELVPGNVRGINFLDGRVAVYRDATNRPHVVSAYCPHNGADLSLGSVVDDQLQCRFHLWRFGADGRCTATGCGDPVPQRARLFKYPACERFGLIWAFNGETPLFELPDLGFPDDELIFHSDIPHLDINADPWVFMSNTLDFNHIKCVHGLVFDQAEPEAHIDWGSYKVGYPLRGHFSTDGSPISYDLSIHGTNIFLQTGEANGRWFAFLFPAGMHRPGTMRAYTIIATRKGDGSPGSEAAVKETLKYAMELETMVVSQDLDILNSIRFARGTLTRADRALGLFMDHISKFPRAHPGDGFIN